MQGDGECWEFPFTVGLKFGNEVIWEEEVSEMELRREGFDTTHDDDEAAMV